MYEWHQVKILILQLCPQGQLLGTGHTDMDIWQRSAKYARKKNDSRHSLHLHLFDSWVLPTGIHPRCFLSMLMYRHISDCIYKWHSYFLTDLAEEKWNYFYKISYEWLIVASKNKNRKNHIICCIWFRNPIGFKASFFLMSMFTSHINHFFYNNKKNSSCLFFPMFDLIVTTRCSGQAWIVLLSKHNKLWLILTIVQLFLDLWLQLELEFGYKL